ncbi:DUF1707 SHOCT-like domain-containing protein [Jiangella alkaliphila]|uniref:DUF1707 domain-containing protein n=1 Tax=Jiangella alkaliphila TaxID=419479 RepID=A0A1H2I582_9ACTN|nr:DUF1707 domain-containing protein [Jiangella alkaliphila]SDU39056.1 protein of unknown function [Jiangella alkaliphila]
MSDPGEPDHLRVGTRERDAALDLLSEHFAAGRLSADEHAQRTGAALGAQTWGELRALLADLPPVSGQQLPARAPDDVQWRLSTALRDQLADEGILLIEEAVQGTITYHDLRTARRELDGRRRVSATIVVTGHRLLVWAAGAKQVDLPVGHPGRVAVTISVHRRDWLRIETDAGRFGTALSGRVDYRFRTTQAARIVDLAG